MSTPTVEERLNELETWQKAAIKTFNDDVPKTEDVNKCLDKRAPKSWFIYVLMGLILAIGLGVAGILNVEEGPQGPSGNDGMPGITGPVGPQGPAGRDGTSADTSALVAQITALRTEIEAIKAKPVVVEKPELVETPKGGMALEVNEQDGDWIVTTIDKVEKDPVLGVTMWVCKGPIGKPIVAEPGTPAEYLEKYVRFTNPKYPRPAGTVFKAHPRPSKRGSVVWVLVKG
jgi:hypothetical protein